MILKSLCWYSFVVTKGISGISGKFWVSVYLKSYSGPIIIALLGVNVAVSAFALNVTVATTPLPLNNSLSPLLANAIFAVPLPSVYILLAE